MTVTYDRRTLLAGAIATPLAVMWPDATDAAAQAALRAPVRLVDGLMTDVRGRRQVRLVSDVMRDRAIALTFFFTGCSSICPVQSRLLSQTQALVARERGSRIAFVSISIDWFGDTPRAIERFAQQHDAGRGWYFLKAPVSITDAIRRGFEAFDPERDNHPPVIAVGRAGAKAWSRLYGFPKPQTIATELRRWLV